jgi:tetratricopeptide (TPR) repeat protein
VNQDLSALWQTATRQFDAAEYEAAFASCHQLITSAPDQPMAYSMMSRLWHLRGRVRPTTLLAFQASQRIAGAHWKDILAISTDLLNVGECHLAHSVLSSINPHDPAVREALLDLGRQYSTLDDQPRALHCIEQAIANGLDGPFVQHMLGIVLSFTGPVERAVDACETSATAAPNYGHAHWSRAQFGKADGADVRLARMRQALETPGLGHDDTTFLHYAMFKELDTLDRTSEAWESLMAGARARRSVTQYSPQVEDAAYDALIHATSDDFVERAVEAPTDATPIFIVGMPRTGTTLLERILGKNSMAASVPSSRGWTTPRWAAATSKKHAGAATAAPCSSTSTR